MELRIIHNKSDILNFVEGKNKGNFMYHLCNIEDDFYEYNQFYGLYDNNELKSIAIFEIKYGFPILIASSYVKDDEYENCLLEKISTFLPKSIYCHLNINSSKYLKNNRIISSDVEFYNMELNKEMFINRYKDFKANERALKMQISEKVDLIKFLTKNNPDFMIEEKYFYEGLYYAIKIDNKIVSSCGIFSDSKEVIQIGNVCTDVDFRRRSLGEACLYEMIRSIMTSNKQIVLNVKKDNLGALRLYKKIGFEVIGEFEEVNFK